MASSEYGIPSACKISYLAPPRSLFVLKLFLTQYLSLTYYLNLLMRTKLVSIVIKTFQVHGLR